MLQQNKSLRNSVVSAFCVVYSRSKNICNCWFIAEQVSKFRDFRWNGVTEIVTCLLELIHLYNHFRLALCCIVYLDDLSNIRSFIWQSISASVAKKWSTKNKSCATIKWATPHGLIEPILQLCCINTNKSNNIDLAEANAIQKIPISFLLSLFPSWKNALPEELSMALGTEMKSNRFIAQAMLMVSGLIR